MRCLPALLLLLLASLASAENPADERRPSEEQKESGVAPTPEQVAEEPCDAKCKETRPTQEKDGFTEMPPPLKISRSNVAPTWSANEHNTLSSVNGVWRPTYFNTLPRMRRLPENTARGRRRTMDNSVPRNVGRTPYNTLSVRDARPYWTPIEPPRGYVFKDNHSAACHSCKVAVHMVPSTSHLWCMSLPPASSAACVHASMHVAQHYAIWMHYASVGGAYPDLRSFWDGEREICHPMCATLVPAPAGSPQSLNAHRLTTDEEAELRDGGVKDVERVEADVAKEDEVGGETQGNGGPGALESLEPSDKGPETEKGPEGEKGPEVGLEDTPEPAL